MKETPKNQPLLQRQSLTPLASRPTPSQALDNSHLGKSAPPVFLTSMTLHSTEYPFGQFRSTVLAVSSPTPLLTPSLLVAGGRVNNRESFDIVQVLVSNA